MFMLADMGYGTILNMLSNLSFSSGPSLGIYEILMQKILGIKQAPEEHRYRSLGTYL